MKKLKNVVFVVMVLFLGTTYAQSSEQYLSSSSIKKYKVSVKTNDELVQGQNKINIKIRHNMKIVTNADIRFKLYHPNGKIVEYKNKVMNDDKNYSFYINLPKKGEYKYVISFNRVGGVIRYSRGSFSL